MGLDGVELIIGVEKEFGIEVSDDAAAQMARVADLQEYVLARIGLRPSWGFCHTRDAFYDVCCALQDLTGVPRRDIRPNTPMGSLFSIETCKESLQTLGQILQRSSHNSDWNYWYWPQFRFGFLRSNPLHFPNGARTVGELAWHVATMRFAVTPLIRGFGWTRETAILRYRQVIHEQMDVEGFASDARFLDDLGID